ncbi:MAG: recombination-associated protein RdgC [Desulfobacterales bacterium]|nr:recombination-associated protein RdgC [Desulfobacterales bacterium]
MGLLSATVSVTRYKVEGKISEPVVESVINGIKKHAIPELRDETAEKLVGWTSFESPYVPVFEPSSVVIGTYFVFALRIDKKTIPAKILTQHFTVEMAKKLAETGQPYLSKSEKQQLKETVKNMLTTRIPFTPHIFEILWNYEDGILWFFSTQVAANEEFETLFTQSFKLQLMRIFPYTAVELLAGLSDAEKDRFNNIGPTSFCE